MASKPETPRADDEGAFLAGYDARAFERPSVAADVSLLSVRDGRLVTFLARRKDHPHRGRWALPGGFVNVRESLNAAASRVLAEKTGVRPTHVEQLFTFGAVDRDPRTRVISVAYYALVDVARLTAAAIARADDVCVADVVVPWAEQTGGPIEVERDGAPLRLAFDHAEQLGTAVQRMREKLGHAPIGHQLLAEPFTLRDLQDVHEAVLDRAVNKDSFRRKVLASGDLVATGDKQNDVDHRPAELYRFARRSAV